MRRVLKRRPPRGAGWRACVIGVAAAGVAAVPAAATEHEAPAAPEGSPPAEAAPAVEPLREGDRGEEVRRLQRALADRGERVDVDGAFGPQTRAAVERAQRDLGMPATGVADAALQQRLGISPASPGPAPASSPPPAPACVAGNRYLAAFPVRGSYTYFDDYGAPRHQGRHEGIDIMAARGTPVVAVADGVVSRLTRSETGLGGIWVWLERADGTQYYYAHLHTIAAGLEAGSRVAVGEGIGTVGNTGDARHGAPHLHFEIRTGARRTINPFPHLRAVDPRRGAAAAECPAPAGGGQAVAEAPRPMRLSPAQLRINQRISQAAVRRVARLEARLAGRRPAAAPASEPGRITLSVRQLRINQRISRAAVRRVARLEARLAGRRPAAAPASEPGRITLSVRQLRINQRISQAALRRVGALEPAVAAALRGG